MILRIKTFTIILSTIVVLIIAGGILKAQTELDVEIPAPEDSSLTNTTNFRLFGRNINGAGYKSQDSLYRLETYYNNFFSQEGFKKILDMMIAGNKTKRLQYRKENLVAEIILTPTDEGTEVGIAKYTLPENVKRIEDLPLSADDSLFALPQQDSKGEDPEGVPRPPESTRLPNISLGEQKYYTYFSKLSLAEAREFYRQQMPYSGWELAKDIDMNELTSNYKRLTGKKDLGLGKNRYMLQGAVDLEEAASNSYVLDFVNGEEAAKITITPNVLEKKEGSIVQILLNEGK